jgi:hypothetical protein
MLGVGWRLAAYHDRVLRLEEGPAPRGTDSAAGKRPEGYVCFLATLKWLAMAMTA